MDESSRQYLFLSGFPELMLPGLCEAMKREDAVLFLEWQCPNEKQQKLALLV